MYGCRYRGAPRHFNRNYYRYAYSRQEIGNSKRCEISSDDDSDFDEFSSKRRRIDNSVNYINRWSSNAADVMSTSWSESQKGFSDYYYSKSSNPPPNGDGKENRQFVSPVSLENGKSSSVKLSGHHQQNYHHDAASRNSVWAAQKKKLSSSDHVNVYKQSQAHKSTQMASRDSTQSFKRPEQNGFRYNVDRRQGRRYVTAQECIRLEECEKYRQLLKYCNGWKQHSWQTPPPFLLPHRSTPRNSYEKDDSANSSDLSRRDSTSSQNEPFFKEKLGSKDREMYARRIFRGNFIYKPPLCPTRSHDRRRETSFEAESRATPVEERIPSPISPKSATDDDSDNSVIITKIQPAKWRSTIFHEYNQDCSYLSPEWLQQWRQRLTNDRKERTAEIEEVEKKIQALKQERNSHIDALELDIRERLRLSKESNEVLKERLIEDLEEEGELLPELTPEAEELVDEALHPHPPDEVLVNEFHLQIRRRDMETLQDQNWLNDEIINFYMNMLMERGKRDNMPSVYACNTFFYPKLITGGHGALKRWTRKVDIFAHDFMLVPVHLGVHWCLAVVNFKEKSLKYYDSMGRKNNECLNALCDYLKAESLDKKKQTFDLTDWVIENTKDIPQQMNCSDCGVFACKYAEYITRNSKISFKQEHMPYFRRRMVYEILTKELM